MASLRGKTVLITGAARRLGRATALAVANAGAGVVAHYQSSEREAELLRQEIVAAGGECWIIRADLASDAEVDSLVQRASVQSGRAIDALVNNASVFPTDTLASVSRPDLERSLAVNAWAPLALCRSLARLTPQGHVVNLLDTKIAGYRFTHVSYQISKQVLATLTRMLAIELGPGIAVNAVAPGLILPPPGQDQNWLAARARTSVPLARPGSPQDVAEAIVFLLGSSYLSGQTIFVDGGEHLRESGQWTAS